MSRYVNIPPVSSGGGASTTTTLTGAGNTLTVSGLDGASDGDYLGYYEIKIAAATGTIKFQVNGADTALYSAWSEMSGVALQGSRSSTTVDVCSNQGSVGDCVSGWLILRSTSTLPRCLGVMDNFQPTGPTARHLTFVYDSATNITSLGFVAANADSMAVGSFFQIQRLGRVYT